MADSDFSNRRHFPGTPGNPFDVILHSYTWIENLPALVFALILFILVLLPGLKSWPYRFELWGFMLVDWLLISSLPRLKISFGPSKPTVLILSILRTGIGFLPPVASLPIQVVGTLLVIYGFWIEPHTIRVTRQVKFTNKIKSGPPLRILHLGDLHVEHITRRELQLNELVKSLHPDIILFSGDFLNLSFLLDPEAWQAVREVVSAWSAIADVYVVTGSPAVDLPEVMPQVLKDLPIHWLQDEKATLTVRGQEIDLVGITCTHKPFVDGPCLRAVYLPNTERFCILLYHTPDLAPEASQAGFDLQLSGHTHGGQVRLPFWGAVFSGSLYGKRFEAGRYQIKSLTLYVTRGIGMEGAGAPRVRFLCPPEIVLWEIASQN
jgi:uncharacterized protein